MNGEVGLFPAFFCLKNTDVPERYTGLPFINPKKNSYDDQNFILTILQFNYFFLSKTVNS